MLKVLNSLNTTQKSEVSSQTHYSLLTVTSQPIKFKKGYFQDIMVWNIHFHSKREEWGHSERILNQNPAENAPNPLSPCQMLRWLRPSSFESCACISLGLLPLTVILADVSWLRCLAVWVFCCNPGFSFNVSCTFLSQYLQLCQTLPVFRALWNYRGGFMATAMATSPFHLSGHRWR